MRITLSERMVNAVIRGAARLVFDINARELEKVPLRGPAILVSNHTSSFEALIYYAFLRDRRKTGLGKRELWKNPFTRFLMQVWKIIPINRAGPDREALKKALQRLDQGWFLGIAPEGTRSRTGCLQQGKPGAAMLAATAGVPIIPLAQWGMTDLGANVRRFRRARVRFAVGQPFRVHVPDNRRPTARELRRIADEIMYQLAVLMPEEYRGYYRDLTYMTSDYLVAQDQVFSK